MCAYILVMHVASSGSALFADGRRVSYSGLWMVALTVKIFFLNASVTTMETKTEASAVPLSLKAH